MFGVRIAILAVSLLGVAALLPLDAAEARTRDAYQGSYSKYLPSSHARSYTQRQHRQSTAHHASRKSTGYKSAHRSSGTSYAAKGAGAKPSRWCGWWMRTQKGGGPELNLAHNWAHWGRPSGPQIGAVVVWSHHVGMITGRSASGEWIVKSGNDGGRVRERPRSVAGAVFRVA